ncbi:MULTISPECIES: TetR/AcrR family transcriptional regulator [unclassified Blastococcus]
MVTSARLGGTRAQRRARIEQTALEMFRVRGFDQVTVEEICAEAQVAPATFYRHFGTKEAVLFAYEEGFTAALRSALDAAAALRPEAHLGAVLDSFAQFLESQRDLLALRDQIVLGHPRLMQRTLLVQRDLEVALAGGLAGLRGLQAPDETALLEAGVGLLVLRVAVRSWRAGRAPSLPAAAAEALDRLRSVVAERTGRAG